MIQKSLHFIQRPSEDCVDWKHICFVTEGLHLPDCYLSVYLTYRFLQKILYKPGFHSWSKEMVMKEISKAQECKILVCHGNVSFYFVGLTAGQARWEPQEQNCETLRLFHSAPLPVIPLHLQPCRHVLELKSFMLYLLLFHLTLHIFFPGFSLSSLNLLSQIMHVFPLAEKLKGSAPTAVSEVAKAEVFQGE